MSEGNIVPFANPLAGAEAAIDRASKLVQDLQQPGDGSLQVIENLLNAIEGMENQVHGLIQLIHDHDKRIRLLEKASKSKIIRGIGS